MSAGRGAEHPSSRFFSVLYMDVVHVALKYGFWIFGGYVRDVIIRGENTYRDIDIGCSWDQMYFIPKFLKDLGDYDVEDDTLQRTGKTQHSKFPFIRRMLKIKTHFETIDIIVFSSFNDFLVQDGAEKVSCNNFYMMRDGIFMMGNFDRTHVDYYTRLTLQKKFIVLMDDERTSATRDKLLGRGWSEIQAT